MPLGPDTPQWNQLAARLAALVQQAGAMNAVVMDAHNALWCRASYLGEGEKQWVFELLARALPLATGPLERGGRIDHVRCEVAPFWLARSFAGIYVLVLWFERPFADAWVRAIVRRALPDIEALTTSLPPPDGPHREAGVVPKP